MNLREYIAAERGNGVRLAGSLGISTSYLSQLASGHRPTPAEMCPLIERFTGALVLCEELRPDVEWAVVRLSDSAEPKPAQAA